MSANEHIEELLSGFLDGELTAEELREFEAAVSGDATLKTKVDQLRQLGNDLRSVPKRKLGLDFSEKVVAASLAAARQPSVAQQVQLVPKSFDKRWRSVGQLIAVAATLLFAVYLFNRFQSTNGPSNEEIAENPPVVEVSPEQVPADSNSKDEAFVRNDPTMRKRVAGQNSVAILTIMEIEPSEKAWKEDEVSKVLKEAGIAWSNPVKVSDDVLGALNKTRSISPGLPQADNEQITLVMVMAKARTLDKALKRILEGVEAFPHVFLDIAFDLPSTELCQKLIDAQGSVANGQGAVATPIVPKAVSANSTDGRLENFSHFTSAPIPPTKYFTAESRQAGQAGNALLADEENAESYILLVIRQPAKK